MTFGANTAFVFVGTTIVVFCSLSWFLEPIHTLEKWRDQAQTSIKADIGGYNTTRARRHPMMLTTLMDVKQFLETGINETKYKTRSWPPFVPSPESGEIIPSTKNRSLDHKLLLYNRVPKCASTTVVVVMCQICYRNQFHVVNGGYGPYQRREHKELEFLRLLYKSPNSSIVLHAHNAYINTFHYGIPHGLRPNYINVVRNPIDRLVSAFYYGQNLERQELLKSNPGNVFVNVTIAECLEKRRPTISQCNLQLFENEGLVVSFFCGSSTRCWSLTGRHISTVLQKAKYNLETKYSVVGITEDLDTTFVVLESYLPRFFKGASQAFETLSAKVTDKQLKENQNSHPPLSEEQRQVLAGHETMRIEQDFYDFAKQRLYQQKAMLVKP